MRKIRNKKVILYIAALALLLLGGKGTDIGRLRPVEVVQLYEKGGLLFLKTDTGDMGWGLTINQAVKKLKETTPGEIYLDTADFLLVEKGMEANLPSMRSYLKGKTGMVYSAEEMDLEAAAAYLHVHRPSGIIGNRQSPMEILAAEGGKLMLKIFENRY